MFKPLLQKLDGMRIILATSSKQRTKVLQDTGLKFEIVPSNFKEDLNPSEFSISDFVEQTALGKVRDVYEKLKLEIPKPDIIIGVDTVISFNGKVYGKPKGREDALDLVTKLTTINIPHMVYSGVVIFYRDNFFKFTEVTTVYMGRLSEQEIEAYINTGEPYGKAGGYAIQGLGSSFVERIDGDYNNVIGLPLYRLTQKLKEIMEV
ncbi:uncharacterized protein LOC108739693 [Agrilus planipennis]|uniref:Uncharacterized protein LOC108739693 n=1 Tax=Agrilus planipennis TaxID=224129 RepID=A0A1W4WZD9_AGRPL|nr:uncharacterized protein LOC108739693 [Agrilus planipennis]